jgi:hypothetical protein
MFVASVVVAVVDIKATSALVRADRGAPVPAPWHCAQLDKFSGWHGRAAGAYSSRDKDGPTIGKAHVRYNGHATVLCVTFTVSKIAYIRDVMTGGPL